MNMNIQRYLGPRLRQFGDLSKPVTLKSLAYLDFIRTQPCIATGSTEGIDAHHVLRKSQGQIDYLTVPLRHDIHIGELHGKGERFVENKYGVVIEEAMIAKMVERIWELELQLGKIRN